MKAFEFLLLAFIVVLLWVAIFIVVLGMGEIAYWIFTGEFFHFIDLNAARNAF